MHKVEPLPVDLEGAELVLAQARRARERERREAQVVRLDDARVQAGKVQHEHRVHVEARVGLEHLGALVAAAVVLVRDVAALVGQHEAARARELQQAREHADLLAVVDGARERDVGEPRHGRELEVRQELEEELAHERRVLHAVAPDDAALARARGVVPRDVLVVQVQLALAERLLGHGVELVARQL
ncbi:hypothetical protein EG877_16180, partial [Enterococcus faecalis]